MTITKDVPKDLVSKVMDLWEARHVSSYVSVATAIHGPDVALIVIGPESEEYPPVFYGPVEVIAEFVTAHFGAESLCDELLAHDLSEGPPIAMLLGSGKMVLLVAAKAKAKILN